MSSFFFVTTKEWDTQNVRDCFVEDDAKLILSTGILHNVLRIGFHGLKLLTVSIVSNLGTMCGIIEILAT